MLKDVSASHRGEVRRLRRRYRRPSTPYSRERCIAIYRVLIIIHFHKFNTSETARRRQIKLYPICIKRTMMFASICQDTKLHVCNWRVEVKNVRCSWINHCHRTKVTFRVLGYGDEWMTQTSRGRGRNDSYHETRSQNRGILYHVLWKYALYLSLSVCVLTYRFCTKTSLCIFRALF